MQLLQVGILLGPLELRHLGPLAIDLHAPAHVPGHELSELLVRLEVARVVLLHRHGRGDGIRRELHDACHAVPPAAVEFSLLHQVHPHGSTIDIRHPLIPDIERPIIPRCGSGNVQGVAAALQGGRYKLSHARLTHVRLLHDDPLVIQHVKTVGGLAGLVEGVAQVAVDAVGGFVPPGNLVAVPVGGAVRGRDMSLDVSQHRTPAGRGGDVLLRGKRGEGHPITRVAHRVVDHGRTIRAVVDIQRALVGGRLGHTADLHHASPGQQGDRYQNKQSHHGSAPCPQ